MPMQKISILGCGWLGFPLAESLLKNGNAVNGSTTTASKLGVFENAGIEAFLLSVSENGIDGDISGFLNDAAVLIIDIPPKLRGENKEDFVAKIQHLIPHIEQSSVQNVLFVSATSVYADDDSVVTEATIPNPQTESGRQLLEAEKLLQGNSNFKTTILRFGGLLGADRHPVKFLSGKVHLENPDAPVNLIHQKDCIGIIEKILEKNVWNAVFNAAYPQHPTRKNYYQAKAIALQLPLPTFNQLPSKGKTIDASKLIQTLGYTFLVPI